MMGRSCSGTTRRRGPTRPDITTPNGFEALKFVESAAYGASERNGVIDARDAAFSRLVLWRDLNHNGLSEPDELQPVTESGLEAISTDYKNSQARRQDTATSSASAPACSGPTASTTTSSTSGWSGGTDGD